MKSSPARKPRLSLVRDSQVSPLPTPQVLPLNLELGNRKFFANLNSELNLPIRIFNLDGIGLHSESLLQAVNPSYQDLNWDYYDVRREQIDLLSKYHGKNSIEGEVLKKYYGGQADTDALGSYLNQLNSKDKALFHAVQPSRRRAAAKFQITRKNEGKWKIQREPLSPFSQKTGDFREVERIFPEMDERITDCVPFRRLFQNLIQIVGEVEPRAHSIVSFCHQVSIVARRGLVATNSPEGIHQDGADFIVSAIVMQRANISGGASRVFLADKKTQLLQVELGVGEGIFQADCRSPLWHDVTPIQVESGATEGVRSILGFDFKVKT